MEHAGATGPGPESVARAAPEPENAYAFSAAGDERHGFSFAPAFYKMRYGASLP